MVMAEKIAMRMSTNAGVVVSIGKGLAALARATGRLAAAIKGRSALHDLADRDDRMLADIGLTRDDLRAAFSQPLWRNPSAVLAARVCARRAGRSGDAAGL